MRTLLKWFTRGTEFIAAMALAAIFVTFLILFVFDFNLYNSCSII